MACIKRIGVSEISWCVCVPVHVLSFHDFCSQNFVPFFLYRSVLGTEDEMNKTSHRDGFFPSL